MTPDEIRNKRLIGYMIPFWSAIACVGIDVYLIAPRGSAFPYRLTLIIPPLVGYWVWTVYLKRLPKP